MKRILAVTLALVLLMAALPLTAMAIRISIELPLDETQEFYVKPGEEVACHYTAEEDGKYVLECPYGEWDYYAKLLDAEGNVLEETDDFAVESLVVELAAGETARFAFGAAGDFEDEMVLPVRLWQVIPVTGMDLCNGRNSITLSLFGEHILMPELEPADATPVSITCEAEDTFMLDTYVWGDGRVAVQGYEVGETTLTVTVDGEYTDTITVYVEEPGEWGDLGTQPVILSPYRQSRTACFTPKESGWYSIFSQGEYDTYLDVWAYDEGNEGYYQYGGSDDKEGFNFGYTDYFEEGTTYYLIFSTYSTPFGALAFPVTVEQAEEPQEAPETGIGFSEDSLTVTVGERFFPDGWVGTSENVVGIESSDEEVVSADWDEGCYALKPGEVTLTVTTESGASDTLTVKVVEPPVLVLDQRTEAAIATGSGMKLFYFTPAESGDYIFRSFSDKDPYISVYNEEGELLEEKDDSVSGLDFYLEMELTAGKTYLVQVGAYEAHTYEFIVARPTPATGITLSIPEEYYTKKEGDTYYIPVGSLPTWDVSFDGAPGAVVERVESQLEDESLVFVDANLGPRWAKAGRTTITAETENGLSDTITVVVYDYLPGDYNMNGEIDGKDVAALKAYLGGADDEFFFLLDVNEDGVVDEADLDLMSELAPVPFLWGDVDDDGAITSTDARLTLQYYAGKITEEDLNIDLADVDGDGEITSTDARLILQYYTGKIEGFPVENM